MFTVVDEFNSPSHRITSDAQRSPFVNPTQWGAKLFRISWVKLYPKVFILVRWWRLCQKRSVISPSVRNIQPQGA
ncbi:hypothetical protein BDM02DRAFT_3115778 [Thelephora ganbajun]|uniref:Uncharacterized protein n=1 Tax=Thelephora ganbajun TaxID=370292 RepID=A0ACB6ZEI9_THEGA|nr:hypothetical protein BDM02DRAFT_3115778 [Thelephora ganbajun]